MASRDGFRYPEPEHVIFNTLQYSGVMHLVIRVLIWL